MSGELLSALCDLDEGRSGALLRCHPDGSRSGVILAEAGRVCWARSFRQKGRMADLLLGAAPTGLSRGALESAVHTCRDNGQPLGEYLLDAGLATRATLRLALLRHTCEAVDDLAAMDARWEWLDHRGRGYRASLTFSPAEVLSGVQALRRPELVVTAEQRLVRAMAKGQHGFALSEADPSSGLVAQIGCDGLRTARLRDLVAHARETAAVCGATASRGTVAGAHDDAIVVFREQGIVYGVHEVGELAFNRLSIQLANITR